MDANLRDVTRALGEWLDAGRSVVLATVVEADGSAPRGLGARLAIAGPEEWIGALSGGCTEAAVIAEAERLLASGDADPDHGTFVEYVKETMVDVGPMCGSTLGVVVELVDDVLAGTLERLVDQSMAGHTCELSVSYTQLGNGSLAREAVTLNEIEDLDARGCMLVRDEEGFVLRQQVPAAPHLVMGGAGDIARELVLLADRLSWRTTVVDARSAILTQLEQACTPTRLIHGWPHEQWDDLGVDSRTACVVLAHEARYDDPFLACALVSDAPYVGAIGSRKVQAARREALAAQGVDAAAIERLHGPAGLDLGGGSASEMALAIAAEIVATFRGRSGAPLAKTTGAIRA